MSYSLEQRVLNLRSYLRANPPSASLAYVVLNRWTLGKDTQEIADRLNTTQAEVCRIIAADQDCRRALVRATA